MSTKGKTVKRTKLDSAIASAAGEKNVPYEFMVILKPLLPEDVRAKTVKSIHDLIESKGGQIEQKDLWGKRHLAYKIKGHEEGYYILYAVVVATSQMKEIERELTLLSDILRFVFIKESEL